MPLSIVHTLPNKTEHKELRNKSFSTIAILASEQTRDLKSSLFTNLPKSFTDNFGAKKNQKVRTFEKPVVLSTAKDIFGRNVSFNKIQTDNHTTIHPSTATLNDNRNQSHSSETINLISKRFLGILHRDINQKQNSLETNSFVEKTTGTENIFKENPISLSKSISIIVNASQDYTIEKGDTTQSSVTSSNVIEKNLLNVEKNQSIARKIISRTFNASNDSNKHDENNQALDYVKPNQIGKSSSSGVLSFNDNSGKNTTGNKFSAKVKLRMRPKKPVTNVSNNSFLKKFRECIRLGKRCRWS